jgi:hypothetical protein
VGKMSGVPGAVPGGASPENAKGEFKPPALVTKAFDEVYDAAKSNAYQRSQVLARYGEGKFAGGANLFYFQATFVYFFLVLVGTIALWAGCEGKEVPIEGNDMMSNQTNTTIASTCDELSESAQIIYTPSAFLMVFMFGILVPAQITKADALKKAVLDHYDSIYILRRVGRIASTYNPKFIQQDYLDDLIRCYSELVISSMRLATIVSRREFMKHELIEPLRDLQHWWSKETVTDGKDEIDRVAREETENNLIEHQLDFLSILYVAVHREANNGSNPASHGVPLNGNTPLSAVLELTAVGQSTFDTRALLMFFAALTAICGLAQKLDDNGELDMSMSWVHIISNYVMVVVPYCLLGPFVFRQDIFKERSPYIPTAEETATLAEKLLNTSSAEAAEVEAMYNRDMDSRSFSRRIELQDVECFGRGGCRPNRNHSAPSQRMFTSSAAWAPFLNYRKEFEI